MEKTQHQICAEAVLRLGEEVNRLANSDEALSKIFGERIDWSVVLTALHQVIDHIECCQQRYMSMEEVHDILTTAFATGVLAVKKPEVLANFRERLETELGTPLGQIAQMMLAEESQPEDRIIQALRQAGLDGLLRIIEIDREEDNS